tara:strand:- start:488 stop:1003 length:516 start_codon:yes stop_codon:yes gene_type:complete
MITQNELKSIISYDPKSGVVTFFKNKKPNKRLSSRGYRKISILGKSYPEHRIVWLYMNGQFPKGQIDHINSVRDDNRIKNLRDVTNQENHKNKTLLSNNKSGVTGVNWCKIKMKHRASITVNLKQIHLGYFSSFFEACCARISSQIKHGFHENHGKGKKYKAIKYPAHKEM